MNWIRSISNVIVASCLAVITALAAAAMQVPADDGTLAQMQQETDRRGGGQ